MSLAFVLIALVTVVSAIAAVSLRNLVHCALSLVMTFAGLAALYLQLGAEFVGFVQVLVYIGAVAILIVFAILLTRGTEPPAARISTATPWAISIAVAAFFVMAGAAVNSRKFEKPSTPAVLQAPGDTAGGERKVSVVSVKSLGTRLMGDYVVPLQVVGLLLTAAMIGAVLIAMPERKGGEGVGEEVERG
jgi:NADH-quinone oxidoreductase subunit J